MKNSAYKQKHTADQVKLHALNHRSVRGVAILQQLIFFLFMFRLQAQAHNGPGSLLGDSSKVLFFLFIYRLQAQANATPEARRTVKFFSLHLIKCRILKRINRKI